MKVGLMIKKVRHIINKVWRTSLKKKIRVSSILPSSTLFD